MHKATEKSNYAQNDSNYYNYAHLEYEQVGLFQVENINFKEDYQMSCNGSFSIKNEKSRLQVTLIDWMIKQGEVYGNKSNSNEDWADDCLLVEFDRSGKFEDDIVNPQMIYNVRIEYQNNLIIAEFNSWLSTGENSWGLFDFPITSASFFNNPSYLGNKDFYNHSHFSQESSTPPAQTHNPAGLIMKPKREKGTSYLTIDGMDAMLTDDGHFQAQMKTHWNDTNFPATFVNERVNEMNSWFTFEEFNEFQKIGIDVLKANKFLEIGKIFNEEWSRFAINFGFYFEFRIFMTQKTARITIKKLQEKALLPNSSNYGRLISIQNSKKLKKRQKNTVFTTDISIPLHLDPNFPETWGTFELGSLDYTIRRGAFMRRSFLTEYETVNNPMHLYVNSNKPENGKDPRGVTIRPETGERLYIPTTDKPTYLIEYEYFGNLAVGIYDIDIEGKKIKFPVTTKEYNEKTQWIKYNFSFSNSLKKIFGGN